eukprot:CAMPEP_0206442258 /NCGR_PEP_ID=MMETSP0324_2-20121206/13724_1 /ASSEMBLY_ACC=CAM_ASM_000836 /TAXON_ID=2866 /ORGANISM="Crypthecodinium cohnii, Strain Seligo" /LENGTH=127 /DNA_ID=CAMNT_0053910085 /DNA_START=23 /DNA_END=407 /DNA_ORIENTATION=-
MIGKSLRADGSVDVRCGAVRALGRLGAKAISIKEVTVLLGCLGQDSDSRVRASAAEALGFEAIGVEGVGTLRQVAAAKDSKDSLRRKAVDVLANFGAEAIGVEGVGTLCQVAEKGAFATDRIVGKSL